MKLRKLICCSVAMLTCLTSLVACGPTAPESTSSAPENSSAASETKENGISKIAFVTNQPIDSEEWLKNLVAGLADWQKEHPDYEVKTVEATSVDEYYPKISACAQAGYDLIITSYSDEAEATIKCAKEYPKIKFGILDGEISNLKDYSNIENFYLNRTQTAFMQGCVAALMTKTKKVGFVGGGEYAAIDQLLAGWQQGIQYIDSGIKDYVVYTNSFTDPTKGKEYALSLINQGCDVIYGAAGGAGTGSAQAAEESNIMYAACDIHYADVAPKSELGSTLYYFDKMVIAFIEDAISGKYTPGGSKEYGMAEGTGVYEFAKSNTLVPDDVKAKITDLEKHIMVGDIKIDTKPLHK